jgi:tetratricopeptide (TPR) repeat protein
MEATDIYNMMDNPSVMNRDTVQQLDELISKYPYFQAARILLLKNIASLPGDTSEHGRFASELEHTAAYAPDRRTLYYIIKDLREQSPETVGGSASMDSFSLIDSFLDEHYSPLTASEHDAPAISITPTASANYFDWALTNTPQSDKPDNPNAPKLKGADLIDAFIEADINRQSTVRFSDNDYFGGMAEEQAVAELQEPQDVPQGGALFTETLAQIYIKQKKYDRALSILRKLIAEYPEKNIYFADQIRFLEKLIINTKKE